MKAYNAFRTQVEKIKTEKDLKDAHISICRAYSAYRISYEQFMELRKMMIFKRAEKGFSWGKGIKKTAQDTEDKNHDDQRSNEKIQTAEPHHSRGLGMQMEQGLNLRGQDSDGWAFL